jgi:hypothetical protein
MSDKIKFDKRNYRKHNDRNKELINKSLKECGAGRSIVIDNDNEIIAGNGIYEQAQKLGLKTKVIETDGSELVVVKRTDLATDDAKRKQLAVMDNSTSDSSEFDFELITADFDTLTLEDWGIDDFTTMDDAEINMPELASGDKEPFQQMTFTLADAQAETIKQALEKIKKTEYYKSVKTFGNENTNGNALFCIIERFING